MFIADDEFNKAPEGEDEGTPKPEEKAPDAKPEGSQKAPDEKGKEGQDPPPDDKPKDPPTDPLANQDLASLLKHPVIGPILNSWADKAGAAQATSAVSQAKTGWEGEAELKVLEERFENMSDEDLGRALKDPDTAASFASLIANRTKAQEEASEEAIAQKGQVYGYAVQVGVYTKMLENSDLPAEKKAELNPDNFSHLGSPGILAWGTAVQEALLEHASSEKAKKLLDEKWEAHLEEQQGGGGASREKTDVSNGRPRGPVTGEMLSKMTPQQINEVPEDQKNAALKAYGQRSK